ncbi:sortase A [Frankineae bacterium MT45]|nr:sortase A [Frankineae bacterium MT45]
MANTPDDGATDVLEPPEPPAQPPLKPHRDRLGLLLSGVGQTLITAGVIVLLFVVYEVWITNIFSAAKQEKVHTELIKQWESPTGDDPVVQAELGLPNGKQYTIPAGTGIAVLYIPRFGKDYAKTIVEGTDASDLEKGPGHYTGTQLPGQKGNFAIAGHRVGKGEPFLNLDELLPGDAVVVQTKATWYVYTVLGDPATKNLSTTNALGVPGREIVHPSNTTVIDPVPGHAGVPASKATESLITLTTCHPKFSATERMIIHGTLTRTVQASGSALPKELPGGTL